MLHVRVSGIDIPHDLDMSLKVLRYYATDSLLFCSIVFDNEEAFHRSTLRAIPGSRTSTMYLRVFADRGGIETFTATPKTRPHTD
ncbi:MAG: hypothetical protein K0S06_3258 [Microvirga sp.]|nr:hypothetical protein [Microvirga sp.]